MIQVGVNENVVLDGVDLNDKKQLTLQFKEYSEESLFDQMSATEVTDGDVTVRIMLFPFKVPDKKDLTDRQKQDRVLGDIKRTRNVLLHFLLNFYAKEDVKLDTYKGTGITAETKPADYLAKHLSQNVLDKVWLNLATEFKRIAIPLVGDPDAKFRLKLRRRSKEKHFPTLPDMFLESRPFIEPMTVDKEASRVKFDDWEISEGLDNPHPTSVAAADPVPAEEKDNMFAGETSDEKMFSPGGEADNI